MFTENKEVVSSLRYHVYLVQQTVFYMLTIVLMKQYQGQQFLGVEQAQQLTLSQMRYTQR
jgi:hypothetical protein